MYNIIRVPSDLAALNVQQDAHEGLTYLLDQLHLGEYGLSSILIERDQQCIEQFLSRDWSRIIRPGVTFTQEAFRFIHLGPLWGSITV